MWVQQGETVAVSGIHLEIFIWGGKGVAFPRIHSNYMQLHDDRMTSIQLSVCTSCQARTSLLAVYCKNDIAVALTTSWLSTTRLNNGFCYLFCCKVRVIASTKTGHTSSSSVAYWALGFVQIASAT